MLSSLLVSQTEVGMTAKKLSASKGRPRARVIVKNVNRPGKSRPVDAANYQAMRRTLLRVLPSKSPGFTLFELYRAVLPRLPADLFPGGAKAGWWMKTVSARPGSEGNYHAQKDQAVAVA